MSQHMLLTLLQVAQDGSQDHSFLWNLVHNWHLQEMISQFLSEFVEGISKVLS
jgi:hypothetical protein